MVAWYATFLCTDKRLVKSKQNFIQFKNIVVSVYKKILNNHIKFTAVGEGKTCPTDKILCFIDIQFQSKGESQRRCFGWLVIHIVPDFREQLSITLAFL